MLQAEFMVAQGMHLPDQVREEKVGRIGFKMGRKIIITSVRPSVGGNHTKQAQKVGRNVVAQSGM